MPTAAAASKRLNNPTVIGVFVIRCTNVWLFCSTALSKANLAAGATVPQGLGGAGATVPQGLGGTVAAGVVVTVTAGVVVKVTAGVVVVVHGVLVRHGVVVVVHGVVVVYGVVVVVTIGAAVAQGLAGAGVGTGPAVAHGLGSTVVL
eukprot:CAMPEP_0169118762 /NCGR_PEP_ID=MMETSP1015-20121227/31174_1 /TAXON_ID=342587 /ORGANISM="Karlodinium micrum, Strain CCMP2283" /LENGTH=146 /DNA_ID=CAMNT_0009181553 /DNA_START=177 /DNA_END=617 /DNA_ORIENTATION=-